MTLRWRMVLVVACAAASAGAQGTARNADHASAFAADVHVARAALAADRGRLWGVPLDTLQWMGVENGRVWLTADPHMDGYTQTGELWTGPLPQGIAPSNTSVTWNGRRWAMVLLPLPSDSVLTERLLVHEAMHVLQPATLPIPAYSEAGASAALLEGPDGRTWLRLELRALAAALRGTRSVRNNAVRDALVFRAARYALATSEEIARERALDVSEGIPEYTGWRITHASRTQVAAALDSAPNRVPSFVRAFPYYTGPAYAFLLDGYQGDMWHSLLRTAPDLQRQLYLAWSERASDPYESLIYQALSGKQLDAQQRETVLARAKVLGARYGAAEIRAAEDARWSARQRQIAELRAKFVAGPTVRIHPAELRFSFNPNGQVSLGDDGTMMANVEWHGSDGAVLTAPGGALVTPTWSELRVPRGTVQLAPGVLAESVSLRGDGWTLELPAGWKIASQGESLVLTPPAR